MRRQARFPPANITKTKVRLPAGIQYLKCGRIKLPELLNPKNEDNSKGCNLLQLQEYHKVNWQEYTFQEVINAAAVKAIFAAVDTQ